MNQRNSKKICRETKKERLGVIKEMYACRPWYIPKLIWKFMFKKLFAN